MSYTSTYNKPALIKGDTLVAWTVSFTKDGAPIALLSARMQFRTHAGQLVHSCVCNVSGSTVTIEEVPGSVTETWSIGELVYSLELTLVGGRVVTWLQGTQPIVKDITF